MNNKYAKKLSDTIRKLLIKRQSISDCGFKNRQCFREQTNPKKHNKGVFKPNCGCCGQCAMMQGYFNKSDIFTNNEQKQINSNFDQNVGFLRDDGCCLPVYLRSHTCLRFICKIIPNPDMKIRKYCKYECTTCDKLKEGDLFFWDINSNINKLYIIGKDEKIDKKVLNKIGIPVFRIVSM